jgi:hypothetical protein
LLKTTVAVQQERRMDLRRRRHGRSMTLLETLPSSRGAPSPIIDPAIWPFTTTVNELDRLCVGGMSMTEVADEFGAQTYVGTPRCPRCASPGELTCGVGDDIWRRAILFAVTSTSTRTRPTIESSAARPLKALAA